MRKTSDGHAAGVVRLSATLDKEIRSIAEQTRLPISQVLNTLVLYALDHMHLEPVKLCEMKFDD